MESQRSFLFIALMVVTYLLFTEYQKENAPVMAQPTVSQTTNQGTSYDGDFIPYNTASVTSGNLWLSTVGFDLSTTPGGPATTTVLESLGTANGSFLFEAWLNVVDNGGLATGNFIDLKTKEVGDSGMFANMKMAGSVDVINASGSVNLHADSIPEPSSIALIALGLLGFIGIRRSKNK